MNLAKLVSISIALLFVQACSHPIEIEGQGDVMSASGNRNCTLENFQLADAVCTQNYAIGAYQETYYPIPRTGWKFDHWVTYCQTATPPNYDCSFNTPASAVYQFWGQIMPPLKAVFTPIDTDGDAIPDDVDTDDDNDGTPDVSDACPLGPNTGVIGPSCIVTAVGKEWAQPLLFTNLSWNAINAACPSGPCIAGSILNNHLMTGWTFAAVSDVRELFNSYGVSPPLVGYGQISATTSVWAPAYFAAFKRTYVSGGRYPQDVMNAIVRDVYDANYSRYVGVVDNINDPLSSDSMNLNGRGLRTEYFSSLGAYFFRTMP